MKIAQQQALTWVKSSVGERFDTDGKYGAQCKDYANAYAQFLGYPLLPSNANEAWSKAQNDFWQKIAYQDGVLPQPGDIVIWNATEKNPYGHIAVVLEATNRVFTSVDQNWHNNSAELDSSAEIIKHNYNSPPVVGFLRPSFDGTSRINEVPQIIIDQLNAQANKKIPIASEALRASNNRYSQEERLEAQKNISENLTNWPEGLSKFSGRKKQAMIDEFIKKRNEFSSK